MRAKLIGLVIVAAVAYALPGVPSAGAAAGVQYGYDAAGRLTSVTDPGGASAAYSYDAVGNLLSITRSPGASAAAASTAEATTPTAPSVDAVEPLDVHPGDTVTVRGSGLGNGVEQVQVRVGGLAATVVSATATSILAVVPPGAASGPVTVTTAGGKAASKAALRVAQTLAADHGRPEPPGPPPLATSRGVTALAGRVLDTDDAPLAGVTVSVGDVIGRTGADGRFLLRGLPVGHHELVIDGGTVAGPRRFGLYEAGVDLARGKTNVLPWTAYLPALATQHAVKIPSPTTAEVVVANPDFPGTEVRVPAGVTIVDHHGKVVTELILTPLGTDRTPYPLAPGMPTYFDLQPGGSYVHGRGLKVVYPNVTNHPPGTKVPFVLHDAEEPGEGWRKYGNGTVTADGRIVPDRYASVYELGGFSIVYNPLCPDPHCPEDGEESSDGDPVNLSTGLFDLRATDHLVPDVLPIALTRVYHQNFHVLGSFGIGQGSGFDVYISPDSTGAYVLALPNGSKVPFTPGDDGVYRAAATPTPFAGASLHRRSYYDFDLLMKDGNVLTFGSKSAVLTGIADRFGNRVRIVRDGNGRVQQAVSPNGRWLALTWDTCAGWSVCVVRVTDNLGRSSSYGYDESGRLTSVVDAAGRTTKYGWAPCEVNCTLLTSITDARNIPFLTNRFDANGRVDRQTLADGRTYAFAYELDGNGAVAKTTVTNPRGVVRTLSFANRRASVETTAVGKPEQQTSTVERDPATGLPTRMTDSLQRATELAYDGLGNVLSVTVLAGTTAAATSSFTYEPRFNRVASTTNPLGRTTKFAYDDVAQTVAVTNPAGATAVTTLAEGQPVIAQDPLGHKTYFSYLNGDLVAVRDPLGRRTTRFADDGGRVRRVTDPKGGVVSYEYDAANQVTSTADQLGGVTSFLYDANGNLLKLTDPAGHATSFAYDKLDRLTRRTDPLGRAATFAYDANGNVTRATDPNGVVTTFGYDWLDRRVRDVYGSTATGSESTVTRAYDKANRLTKVVDTGGPGSPAATISLAYSARDLLVGETTPLGKITYTYDKAGRRTSATVAGRQPVTYGYDSADRPVTVAQGAGLTARLAYDKAGRRTRLTLPNGVRQDYAYDAASQLTSLKYIGPSGAVLGDLAYTYDQGGLRSSVSGSFARTGLPEPMAGAAYNAANEATAFDGATLSYDKEGRLTSDGSASYSWNARGQLVSVTAGGAAGGGGGAAAAFAYDAFGRRVSKTVAGVATSFLHDGADVVEELAGPTQVAAMLNGPGVDEHLARTTAGGGTRFFLADGLGSTLGLTDSAGAMAQSYTYEPFGRTSSTAGGAGGANPYQFTGRENDETGLHFHRARYYSPTLQRFISSDPVGFGGGDVNLSAYVGNSPTNFVDPTGLWLESVIDVISIAYDIGKLVTGGRKHLGENLLALGLDVAGLLLPVVTGLGAASRAARAANHAEDAASAARPNRIYSARELIRRAEDGGPNHNFPGTFDDVIFDQGSRTVVPGYYNKSKPLLTNDTVQYRLPGSLNGKDGTYEIFTRPSVSGRNEVIMHRLFRPDK